MDKLIEDIAKLTGTIKIYCNANMGIANDDNAETSVALVEAISSVFPRIIALYDLEELNLDSEGKQYWTKQLKRMFSALESEDKFEKWDVFQIETVEALNQIRKFLEDRQNA